MKKTKIISLGMKFCVLSLTHLKKIIQGFVSKLTGKKIKHGSLTSFLTTKVPAKISDILAHEFIGRTETPYKNTLASLMGDAFCVSAGVVDLMTEVPRPENRLI